LAGTFEEAKAKFEPAWFGFEVRWATTFDFEPLDAAGNPVPPPDIGAAARLLLAIRNRSGIGPAP
jgi:hypothetical protein